MKKTILAACAIVAMASCAKENGVTEPVGDKVAAKFTSAAISRVANNAWEANDKIGISMTESGKTTLADGSYENIPHTVGAAGASGTFSADDKVVYFPVDGSAVDFYAYYPCSTVDGDKNISFSVADQEYDHIDLIAAKAEGKTKAAPAVTFAGEEAFAHQLSKLTINVIAGEGISSLEGLETTIEGQYTTAKFNIYSGVISGAADVAEITALTSADGAKVEAVLIPTAAVTDSKIVFALGGNKYYWETGSVELSQGCEHTYGLTLNRTGVTVTGSEINDWTQGSGEDGLTADDLF